MAKKNADPDIQSILNVLGPYKKAHRQAKIDVVRRNNAILRIRIIDQNFKGLNLVQRDNLLWTFLDNLPEDVFAQITMLLLLTPEEAQKSWVNLEFDELPALPC